MLIWHDANPGATREGIERCCEVILWQSEMK